MDEKVSKLSHFEADGKSYHLNYTKARIDLYEDANDESIGQLLWTSGFFLKHSQLVNLIAYGIREEGGDFVNPERGREMAEKFIDTNGYMDSVAATLATLRDDCGFLFMESTL